MHPAAKKSLWWGIGLLVASVVGSMLGNVLLNAASSFIDGGGQVANWLYSAMSVVSYALLPPAGTALIGAAVVINVLAPKLDRVLESRADGADGASGDSEDADRATGAAETATDASTYDAVHIASSDVVNPYEPPPGR